VVSHSFVAERWGFDRGFDAFDSSPIAGQRAVTSDAVTDAAIAFVDAHADEPFFLFAHYFDPHFALIDHPEFGFRDPGPPYVGRVRSPVPFLVFGRADAGVTPREAREMLRIYDSEVAYTDRQVGRLLDHLRGRGLYDPAVIVLAADHGEEYLDHGRIGHTKTLFDELLRVPLILKVPGVPPRVEPGPVALVDVFPTLLDALGLPAPAGLVGRSLLETPDPERPIYAETSRQARLRSVVVGREKLVRDLASGRDRLFDLQDDPAERRDLAAARPGHAAALGRLLGAWQARHGRARPALPPVRVDPAERERLRALGYGE
jgi:arylsulfatase A-like enzyme